MKLSIDTCSLAERFGEEKAFKMIKDAGFDCVDYSMYWHILDRREEFFGDGYVERAKRLRKCLDDLKIACNQAHAPFEYVDGQDTMDTSNYNYRNLIRSIEIASILGAENIVVHSIKPSGNESVFDLNYRYFKSFEPYLEKFKIHLAIENLFGEPYDNQTKQYTNNRFHRPELIKEIIAKLDSKWFVCCVDLGHASLTGIEPQDFVRGMQGGLLKSLHVHDNDYERDRHWLPFMGKFNWNEIGKALKEVKYDGDLTLEICPLFNNFDEENIQDLLNFVEKVGRQVIKKCM